MVFKDFGIGFKENGREHYLYLQNVSDDDVALLEHLGYQYLDCNKGKLADNPDTETFVKYEDETIEARLIKALLSTLTYDELTEKQEKLVTKYETELWKAKVNELVMIQKPTKEELEDQIHDWWLDYQFTDGTEDDLLAYAEEIMSKNA